MIRRIMTDSGLLRVWENSRLSEDKSCVEALKIYALWRCYGTKYGFCRFYAADGALVCGQGGSFVAADYGDCDFEELADFLAVNGFAEIFCSERAGAALSGYSGIAQKEVCLMRFEGEGIPCETEKDTPLQEFFGILKTAFDIEFEPWYLDMSHRVRHGVAQTRRLEGSVLVIQHDLFGSALISQVATVPSERRKGGASRLISAVCAELSASGVYAICEEALRGFYEKNDFTQVCKKYIIRSE